jgi:hypothetical protein
MFGVDPGEEIVNGQGMKVLPRSARILARTRA